MITIYHKKERDTMTGINRSVELTADQMLNIKIALEHYVEFLEGRSTDARYHINELLASFKETLEYISTNLYDEEGRETQ